MVVPKSEGTAVRLCGDCHVTLNSCITVAHYPSPLSEDVCESLTGGISFTALDLSKAYLQLEMEAKSREPMAINIYVAFFVSHACHLGLRVPSHFSVGYEPGNKENGRHSVLFLGRANYRKDGGGVSYTHGTGA